MSDSYEAIDWWHSIDLGDGRVTPGRADTGSLPTVDGLPADLGGKTVLDVGAWDGFYSFEAERRGAARVLATDSWAWRRENGDAGFRYARDALSSKVESKLIDVMELSPEALGGTFDVTLFLGVLYHMRDPLLALERVASVTDGIIVVETFTEATLTRRPSARFYPFDELAGDSTNWWGPNQPAVLAMLAAVGFGDVEVLWPAARGAAGRGLRALSRGERPLLAAQRGRLVARARPPSSTS